MSHQLKPHKNETIAGFGPKLTFMKKEEASLNRLYLRMSDSSRRNSFLRGSLKNVLSSEYRVNIEC